MADYHRQLTTASVFSSAIEDSVAQIAEVRREFVKNNRLVSHQSIRPIIRESWQRCITLIEPGLAEAPIVVASDAGLRDLQIINEPFLKAARPVVLRLKELFSGSGYLIGLADRDGCLLQVIGDRNELRRMEMIGLTPGGNWSESSVGTNGIGTAIAVNHAVAVVGPEHFCDSWQNFSCITAPIHSPDNGEIAGVLDLSGDYRLIRPFFTGILTAAALEIRENFRNLLSSPPQTAPLFQIALSSYRDGRPGKANDSQLSTNCRTAWRHPYQKTKRTTQKRSSFERRTLTAERLAFATGMVSTSLELENTLTLVAQQAAYLLGYESAAVCILDKLGTLKVLRTWCKQPSCAMGLIEMVKILVDQTKTVKQLLASGEPVAIDDVTAGLPNNIKAPEGIRAIVLLPLLRASKVNGFIAVTRPDAYIWQPEDLQTGLTFAFQAATAVENSRLYHTLEQRHRQVEALNAVNQLLHLVFDPAQQLDLIIERIIDIMGLDGGMILLDQGLDNFLSIAAQAGLPDAILDDLAGIAIENSTRRDSVLFCQKKLPKGPITEKLTMLGLYSIIVTPLVAGADLLGVLLLTSHQHRELTPESLTLFTSIGQQLGLALKNAQLLRSAGETQALREADRIKSRFLMMVSHDLRSPLTAINTSIESLLDLSGQPSTESQEHLLGNIASQSKRLGRLVDQLLDLTRIEARALVLDRDWTELDALIVDTVAKFQRLNAPCRIIQNLANDLPLVYIDPERIVQVIWNLLENAHKYAPVDEPILVDAFLNSGEIFISVADRGPGIPEEDREKIFQYFYRQPREQELHTPGSGLGLAICRGILDAHEGRIWVEDRPGGGSAFFAAIPHRSTDSAYLTGLDSLTSGGLIQDVPSNPVNNHLVK